MLVLSVSLCMSAFFFYRICPFEIYFNIFSCKNRQRKLYIKKKSSQRLNAAKLEDAT